MQEERDTDTWLAHPVLPTPYCPLCEVSLSSLSWRVLWQVQGLGSISPCLVGSLQRPPALSQSFPLAGAILGDSELFPA